jgi:hypothetical protein
MQDDWTTKTRYVITWLSAANQMTYAALAETDVPSQHRLSLATTQRTARVIDFWSGQRLESPECRQPRR